MSEASTTLWIRREGTCTSMRHILLHRVSSVTMCSSIEMWELGR